MLLPPARGPVTSWLFDTLTDQCGPPPDVPGTDPLTDDDLQLALWVMYELHFRGFDDVPDEREWDVDVLQLRHRLEAVFLRSLRDAVDVPDTDSVVDGLRTVAGADGPSTAKFLRGRATLEQFREFVAHRSVYHLKEADPHTFALPRLSGPAKAAFVEIQADEYGGGRFERMHSTLFADMMRELDLDPTYGHYVAEIPAVTLATNNLMSLFGLHRRWRGAAAGHLAYIEMTSSVPSRRCAQGLRRLGRSDAACRFYDEHVEADSVHEQIALHDLCAALVQSEPALAADVVFGAACAAYVEARFADHVLDAWTSGHTSLRTPLPTRMIGSAA